MGKMPKLIIPVDNHSCLLVHVVMNDAVMINMQTIFRSYDVLGRKLMGSQDLGVIVYSFSGLTCDLGITDELLVK